MSEHLKKTPDGAKMMVERWRQRGAWLHTRANRVRETNPAYHERLMVLSDCLLGCANELELAIKWNAE